MAIEDTAEGWLGSDLLFGGMWDSIIETSAEKEAKRAREQAAKLAQDELALKKAVHEENKGSWNDLQRDLFGRSAPEDIEALAQEMADRRADAGGVESSNVTTPSGRKGRFDFGSPGQSAPQQTAAPAPTPYAGSNPYGQNLDGSFDPTGSMQWQAAAQQGVSLPGTPAPSTAAAPTKNAITERDRQRALAAIEANKKNTLPGQLETARGKHSNAVDKLIADLGGIDRVEAGEFQDSWNVDDNKQYVSDEARAAQKQSMDKTWGLTDTKETAEEKLMREVARRSMETDLRGQREAQANDLRTRGAYGSGAELAGFYGAQQELAQRRSLEEMGANANAQKRAIMALDSFGNQAMQLGQQDIQSGMAQDMNSRFNSESQQGFQKHKTKVQQEENEAQARRSATEADAKIGLADKESGDAKWLGNFKAGITSGKAGNNFTGAQLVGDATRNLGQNFQKQALGFDADDAANSWGMF